MLQFEDIHKLVYVHKNSQVHYRTDLPKHDIYEVRIKGKYHCFFTDKSKAIEVAKRLSEKAA